MVVLAAGLHDLDRALHRALDSLDPEQQDRVRDELLGRLYYFTTDGAGDALPSLLEAASSPDGRRQLVRLLGMRDFRKSPAPNALRPEEPPRETKEGANNHVNNHA